ncbi:MAG: penicillin-binding protein activator LpoB [Bdellovibrionaceae bacterium]|nr:penicillin-binding protein activator LpoB [Bdellovibrio sp.]
MNLYILILAGLLGLSSCGPKAFVKGQYDDVQRENLMNDQWSETDMQVIVKAMVDSLTAHPAIANAKKIPIVMVTNLQNKTSEHIDTQSIMDMVRVDLTNSGKVGFVDKEARQDMSNEYDYQNTGMVSGETKTKAGGQTGADFIINGRLDSITQEVGKDKSVYYKITLNLTNLKTGIVTWTNQKQLRKTFKKKSVGL